MDLANDSQPDDAPYVDTENEVSIARAVFRRSAKFGRDVKVDEADLSRNLATITSAAEEGCFVIAYLHHHHWAPIWSQVPEWVGAVAKKCIDAGAAMFVSHGAPVLQPVEIYRGRPIFYSLGNFVFHVRSVNSPWKAREVWESVVGLCTFGVDGKLASMCFHPVAIGGNEVSRSYDLEMRLVPEVVDGADAQRILHRFREHSAKFGTEFEVSGGMGFLKNVPG
jgi:poly-gamma-glutamate capsule biosynthesis protein CapA/YwtB (metallophosphatase superfamily)